MVGGDGFAAAISEELAPQPADRFARFEQRLGGVRPEADDVLRLEDFQLPLPERAAIRKLVRLRRAVVRRAAFERVQNVDLFPLPGAGLDDLVEQLPRPAD